MTLRFFVPLLSLLLAGDALAQSAPRSDLPPGDFMLMGADGDSPSTHAAFTVLTSQG